MINIDFDEIAVFIHIIGVALGAGGAFITDVVFINMIKSKTFEKTHIKIITLISKTIWIGAAIVVSSGLVLFIKNSEYYLGNPQFLAKMTIVAIILINGATFHFYQLPLLEKLKDKPVGAITKFSNRREILLVSGAFSSTSWVTTIILGSTIYKEWNYFLIMATYLVVITGAATTALILRNYIIPKA